MKDDKKNKDVTQKGIEDEIKKLNEELSKCKEELEKCMDGWKRERASAINMQKDYDRRLSSIRREGENDVLLRIIGVVDDFDMAIGSKGWDSVDHVWRVGVEMIKSNLEKILEDFGVSKMEIGVGGEFDFNKHNAVGSVECEDSELSGKIAKIIKTGYVRGDEVIRPAVVEVYKLKNEQ